MHTLPFRTYTLIRILAVAIISSATIYFFFAFLAFPRLNTNLSMMNDWAQTIFIVAPLSIIFIGLECFCRIKQDEQTLGTLIQEIIEGTLIVSLNTLGIYSALLLTLLPSFEMIPSIVGLSVIVALIAFAIFYYRRYAEEQSFLSIIRRSLHNGTMVLSAISVVLLFMVVCNDQLPIEIEGDSKANSRLIAETIAFGDQSFFSMTQDQKVDMYADFVAAEAVRLGLDPADVKIKPLISYNDLTGASYNHDSKTIRINVNGPFFYYAGNSEVQILLHELFHAYQTSVVSGEILPSSFDYDLSDHAEEWRKNTQNYISADEDISAYSNQSLEVDADSYAEQRTSELVDIAKFFSENKQS